MKLSYLIDNYQIFNTIVDNIYNVFNNYASTNYQHTVIHNDISWSSSILHILIFGFVALRLHLLKGSPASKALKITKILAAYITANLLVNTINDPEYVEKHINSWKRVVGEKETEILESC